MTKNLENLYSLDVEADGPCPGLYSMLSFGLVPLAAPEWVVSRRAEGRPLRLSPQLFQGSMIAFQG